MATLVSAIVTQVRDHLIEPTARFWSDAELIRHLNLGVKDLWKAINDLYQDHFLTIDATNVSFPASSDTLTGVPADVGRIHKLEVRDLSGAAAGIKFTPTKWNTPAFEAARMQSAQDPSLLLEIMYAIVSAGAPVAAPVVYCAPRVSSALPLRLAYVPTLATLVAGDNVPIPGEADMALVAWTVAYARAKEREDRSPDPEWLAVYATEKSSLLTSLTPRQAEEDEYAEAMFDGQD